MRKLIVVTLCLLGCGDDQDKIRLIPDQTNNVGQVTPDDYVDQFDPGFVEGPGYVAEQDAGTVADAGTVIEPPAAADPHPSCVHGKPRGKAIGWHRRCDGI